MNLLRILLFFLIIFPFKDTCLSKTIDQNSIYNDDTYIEIYDPYEKINRKILTFNAVLDSIILKPSATLYYKVTNNFLKQRVENIIYNINLPITTVNSLLQLDFNNSIKSLTEFIINTTMGIGGIFNISKKFHISSTPQVFSDVLIKFNVPPGPYIMLPILGGTSLRNICDFFVNPKLNPIAYTLHNDMLFMSISGINIIHQRANSLPITDYISKYSADPYIALRSIIWEKHGVNNRVNHR